MARGFDSTLGSSSNDIITSTLNTNWTVRSWHIMMYMRTDPATNDILWRQHSATGVCQATIQTVTPKCNFFCHWNAGATLGIWSMDRPALTTWHSVGWSYDRGSTSNDPVGYINGASQTITESAAPSGAAENFNQSTYIGNEPGLTASMDGMLAEFAAWDAILTAAEFASLGKGFSALGIRPQSRVCYHPMVRENVGLPSAPTISGTAVQPHPRIIMPAGPM